MAPDVAARLRDKGLFNIGPSENSKDWLDIVSKTMPSFWDVIYASASALLSGTAGTKVVSPPLANVVFRPHETIHQLYNLASCKRARAQLQCTLITDWKDLIFLAESEHCWSFYHVKSRASSFSNRRIRMSLTRTPSLPRSSVLSALSAKVDRL